MRGFAASGESSSATGDDKSASALLSARVKQIEALTQAEVGSKQVEIDIKKAAAEADLGSKKADLDCKKAMAEVTLKKALLDLQMDDVELNNKKALAELTLKKALLDLQKEDVEINNKKAVAKKTAQETENLRWQKLFYAVNSAWTPVFLLFGGAALALLVRLC